MKKGLLICITILISLSIGAGYYLLVFAPKDELQKILTEFELACRNDDITKLREIVSEESVLYKHLDGDLIKINFAKFQPSITVTKAKFTPAYGLFGQTYIEGEAVMRAVIDGETRSFDLIFIEKSNKSWKVIQFGFPDYINY